MKKLMKMLALTMALCLVCLTPAFAESDKVYHIGIIQLVQHLALDQASQGFMDKLTELLGE